MPLRHFLLPLALAGASVGLLSTAALAGPRYTITALPANTTPAGINNAGQIVGDIGTGGGRRGFLWSSGGLVELGTLGGSDSTALAINAGGQAVGYSGIASGDSRAFLYAGGVLTDLNVFGGAISFGTAINNSGQVAGQYLGGGTFRAFTQNGGVSTDLGTLGGSFAYAAGINSRGQIVGGSALDDTSPFLSHAFLYQDGVMTDLGTLGGSFSLATAINDHGQVVGNAWVDGSEHAFMYADGIMVDLGTLGGRRSFANAINASGVVVGNANDSEDFDYFAFIYEAGIMTNLNSLIDPALGWTLHSATGVNDSGQIAAYGCRDGECGALLLDLLVGQVPEPGSMALVLSGLALIGRRRASAAYRRA